VIYVPASAGLAAKPAVKNIKLGVRVRTEIAQPRLAPLPSSVLKKVRAKVPVALNCRDYLNIEVRERGFDSRTLISMCQLAALSAVAFVFCNSSRTRSARILRSVSYQPVLLTSGKKIAKIVSIGSAVRRGQSGVLESRSRLLQGRGNEFVAKLADC